MCSGIGQVCVSRCMVWVLVMVSSSCFSVSQVLLLVCFLVMWFINLVLVINCFQCLGLGWCCKVCLKGVWCDFQMLWFFIFVVRLLFCVCICVSLVVVSSLWIMIGVSVVMVLFLLCRLVSMCRIVVGCLEKVVFISWNMLQWVVLVISDFIVFMFRVWFLVSSVSLLIFCVVVSRLFFICLVSCCMVGGLVCRLCWCRWCLIQLGSLWGLIVQVMDSMLMWFIVLVYLFWWVLFQLLQVISRIMFGVGLVQNWLIIFVLFLFGLLLGRCSFIRCLVLNRFGVLNVVLSWFQLKLWLLVLNILCLLMLFCCVWVCIVLVVFSICRVFGLVIRYIGSRVWLVGWLVSCLGCSFMLVFGLCGLGQLFCGGLIGWVGVVVGLFGLVDSWLCFILVCIMLLMWCRIDVDIFWCSLLVRILCLVVVLVVLVGGDMQLCDSLIICCGISMLLFLWWNMKIIVQCRLYFWVWFCVLMVIGRLF